MCGIVALANLDGAPVDPELLRSMRDAMVHRGPDDAGLHIDGPVGLGHRRLSIVDLTPAGHQPMCNEDGTVWLVFNGEIYNYVELVDELERAGHHFRSRTDSEVIVHLWEELGERCVDRLTGMFGFVIWDARRRVLFGARDRAGIKPFQYAMSGRRFVCASEIKAILEDPAMTRTPDYRGLADYLFAGSVLGDKTCFEGIHQLPPGWALALENGKLRTWKYWDVPYAYDRNRPIDDTIEQLADLVEDAVRIHCRSDASLGCHLSGGLDSSTIVGIATRYRSPLESFSIRFDEGGFFDETRYARIMSRHAGTLYYEATPGPDDFTNLLGALVWHMDMPMPGTGGFSYYTVSRLASEHVKVSLTGHGGDEIFAGYPAQFHAALGDTSMFDRSTQPADPPRRALRTSLVRRNLGGALRRLLGGSAGFGGNDLASLWMRLHCQTEPGRNAFLLPEFKRAIRNYTPRGDYIEPLLQADTAETLDKCLYHDLRSYLPGLLHQEDRVSMAVSLESRVPLLDHRIIEFLGTVPPEQKIIDRQPKALLRRAAARWLPPEVRDRRDKGPFGVPTTQWFSGALAAFVRDILLSPSALERGLFDPGPIRRGETDPAELWAALNIEIWFRIFFDRDSEWIDRIGAARTAGAIGS